MHIKTKETQRNQVGLKNLGYIAIAALLLVALFQPWSYNHRGFAEVRVSVAGGEIDLSLYDQAGAQKGNSYCLFSTFLTNDQPGEAVAIGLDRIGTRSTPELSTHVDSSGETFRIQGVESTLSYFEGPSTRLVFPTDEPLDVQGSIHYKGVSHRFQTSMKLRHWEKSRTAIKFCL